MPRRTSSPSRTRTQTHRGIGRTAGLLALTLATLIVTVVAVGTDAPTARSAGAGRFVSVWVPYWDASAGSNSYGDPADAAIYGDVSPFFFQAQGAGSIAVIGDPTQFAKSVATARRDSQIKVIPTITDGTGKGVMAAILADDTLRAGHIGNLVDAVVSGRYDGIDLDYEGFAFSDGRVTWPTTMPLWVRFVQELSTALHAKGKLLSVTIPPVWHDGAQQDYWVYAQEQIAPLVDRLRLMVYDWSPSTPSATAPVTWVSDVVDHSTKVFNAANVPVTKLQLGVPAYGRHWRQPSKVGEICPDGSLATRSVKNVDAPALAAAHGATMQRDDASGEITFTWTEKVTGLHTASGVIPPAFVPPDQIIGSIEAADGSGAAPALRLGPPPVIITCTVRHKVFYPDAASIAQKAQVALDHGWAGIIVWAAGYESADVYDALRPMS